MQTPDVSHTNEQSERHAEAVTGSSPAYNADVSGRPADRAEGRPDLNDGGSNDEAEAEDLGSSARFDPVMAPAHFENDNKVACAPPEKLEDGEPDQDEGPPARHDGEALNVYKIRCYGDELRREGGCVPAREIHPDEPYMTYLADTLGIAQSVLSQPVNRKALMQLGRELGYATVHRARSASVLTVAELKFLRPALTPALIKAELAAASAELMHALSCHTAEGTEADARLALDWYLTPRSESPPHGSNVAKLARALLDFMDREFAEDRLPNDTRRRLAVLLHRRGMKAAELARAIAVDEKRLGAIIHGRLRFTKADHDALVRMEAILGQPPGSLLRANQFAKRGVGSGFKDPGALIDLDERERTHLALFLPEHFHGLDEAEQTEAVNEALALIAAALTPEKAAQVRLRANSYALIKPGSATRKPKTPTPDEEQRVATKTTPERLQREFDSIAYFYGAAEADLDVTNDRARWSPATIEIRLGFLRSITGFLCDEARGAVAVPLTDLTVACLIRPEVLRAYFAFRRARANDAYKAEGLSKTFTFTVEFLGILEFIKILLDPHNGWMTQKSALAERLRPIDATDAESKQRDPDSAAGPATSLVSQKTVAKAAMEGGWDALCEQAYADYRKWIGNQRKKVIESRDAHTTIRSILKSDKPYEAIEMAIAGLRRELAALAPDTIAFAEVMRDLIAVHIEGQTGFRRRTILALEWRSDNRGHLKRRPASALAQGISGESAAAYSLEVERCHFKEPEGPFFIKDYTDDGHAIYEDYQQELEDVNGFYADLAAYLDIYRPMIMRGRSGDALLVGSRNADPRLTPGALDQLSRRIWNRHMIWNPLRGTGFPGISTTAGWHAWRHIIATAVLKATGSYQLAADAIQDSVDMARSAYTRYFANDRGRKLRLARRQVFGIGVAA